MACSPGVGNRTKLAVGQQSLCRVRLPRWSGGRAWIFGWCAVKRLDDAAQPSTARLRRTWQRSWRREDGASMVLPYEKGIHRVANPGSRPAISVHLYGPRMGILDGRDYDPARDFVCDRLELEALAGHTIDHRIAS